MTNANKKLAFNKIATLPISMSSMTELHLVMGTQCNIRCSFCYQKSFSPKDDLPENVVEELLPHINHVKHLIVQGGEPTVMKSCKRLRDYLTEIDFQGRVCFLTNGVLFTDEWINFMLDRYGDVHFSINASSTSSYDKITKYGNFEAAINNISTLINRRKERNQKHPLIDVSYVICKDNLWDVKNFFQTMLEVGVDACTYYIDCRDEGKNLVNHLDDSELDLYHNYIIDTVSLIKKHNYNPTELVTIDYFIKEIKAERKNKHQNLSVGAA